MTTEKTSLLVGKRLGEELEKMGIGAEVYTKPFQAKWNRLYQASRKTVVEAMNQNNDLKYFIDVHRDSKRRNKTTHHINGKPYATIAFVVGTANDNWEENEKFARQVHNKLEELYPGLSKGVFRKSRAQGNGEYNQSLSPRSLLVEIGGVDNTFEEAYGRRKPWPGPSPRFILRRRPSMPSPKIPDHPRLGRFLRQVGKSASFFCK